MTDIQETIDRYTAHLFAVDGDGAEYKDSPYAIARSCGTTAWDKVALENDSIQLSELACKLFTVIKEVHSQHADDLCWMPADVNKIFEAAGLSPQDLRCGDKTDMIVNCARYIECLEAGGPWKSYAELELENKKLRLIVDRVESAIQFLKGNTQT